MLFVANTLCTILYYRGRHGRDRMVVGFSSTCAIRGAYRHQSCEFEPRSGRCAIDTTLCSKVYQGLATGQWISMGTPVSTTNKTDRHDITEILLKMTLKKTINQPNYIT